jgi:methionyl-tRNA formyltransferase
MIDRKPRILFMGTPEFAVPSLEGLVEKGYPLQAVVTQPDRPRGRGRKSEAPPVKKIAEKFSIPVLQPERVRDEEFLRLFREIAPDMVVLVAFGQILPREILEHPPMGCLNVHPSLLPRYRGAAPINWALIRGEEKTGVTIILMDVGVDSGDMIIQEETIIGAEDNFDSLHDRLAKEGARLLLKAIEAVLAGEAKRTSQDHALATYAPRLKKEDGRLSWDGGVRDILNRIRGLSSTPGAYSYLKGRQIKIFSASGETVSTQEPPGRIGKETEQGLPVAVADGYVYLKEIQLEGKKRMPVREFLRGYRISSDETLG